MEQKYEVKLAIFEGPLDLLLHLVNKLEIDLYDIPVSTITEQYMEYIEQMQYLELNIASEYLVMAATLIALKSRLLLPIEEIEIVDNVDEEDPREELRERLLEYSQFKQLASSLEEKEGELAYTRTRAHFNEEAQLDVELPQDDVTVYDMLGALSKMMQRKQWNEPLPTTVERVEVSVETRMNEMLVILEGHPYGILFEHLFTYKDKGHIVTTFMALLELMRKKDVQCVQKKHFEQIRIFIPEVFT